MNLIDAKEARRNSEISKDLIGLEDIINKINYACDQGMFKIIVFRDSKMSEDSLKILSNKGYKVTSHPIEDERNGYLEYKYIISW